MTVVKTISFRPHVLENFELVRKKIPMGSLGSMLDVLFVHYLDCVEGIRTPSEKYPNYLDNIKKWRDLIGTADIPTLKKLSERNLQIANILRKKYEECL